MQKKRILGIVAASMLSFSILSGCGAKTTTAPAATNDSKYKDGTYKAEYDKLDSHGWKAVISIVTKDGKITETKFDYVDKDGKLKSQNDAYNKAMLAKNKTNPAKYTVELDKQLVDKQDITKIDAITGATDSSNNFKALGKAALDKAAKGDTATAVLPLPAEK